MRALAKDVRQAVIMVGGKGTRLRPLTDNCPKPILPVLDRPCLEYFIDSLIEAGIEEIILACGYKSEKMAYALGDGSKQGISIKYSYEDHPLGTGGAMKILEDRLDDVFVAVNGDVFTKFSVDKEINDHIDNKADVTISLARVDNPCEYGIVRLDETGKIIDFKEKPKPEEVFSNLINSGVYVINKEVLRFIPDEGMYDFSKELVPLLVNEGRIVRGHPIDGTFRDVGRPNDLFDVNVGMAAKLYSNHDWSSQVSSSKIENEFYAGFGTEIDGCELNRAIIHKNCKIVGSKLKNTLVLSDCNINSAILTGSIIGKNCTIGKGAQVIDSVLADETVVSEGQVIRDARGA